MKNLLYYCTKILKEFHCCCELKRECSTNHGGQLLCNLLPEVLARIKQAVFSMSYFPPKVNANMADAINVLSRLASMNPGSSGDDTERCEHFWNRASIEMKFSVEKLWLDTVWKCKEKPNYGVCNLDAILEEHASNKLELTGPLIDGFLCKLGNAIPPVRLLSCATYSTLLLAMAGS